MRFVGPDHDRRRFHRAQVPILIRPVSALARFIRYQVQDLGLGGLRCYSDEAHTPGKRLEIEIAFPEGGSAVALVEVVWNEALPAGAPARNDVGLRFVDAGPDDRDRIAALMAAHESA